MPSHLSRRRLIMSWIAILVYSKVLLSPMPVMVGLIKWKNLNPVTKAIFYLTLCMLIAEWGMFLTAYFFGPNWFFLPVGTALFAVPAFIFFMRLLPHWQKPISILLVGFAIVQALEAFVLRSLEEYNGLTNVYLGLTLGFLGIRSMIHIKRHSADLTMTRGQSYVNIFNSSALWASVGIAMFYVGPILNNSLANTLIRVDITQFFNNWGVFNIIGWLYLISLTIALWKVPSTISMSHQK